MSTKEKFNNISIIRLTAAVFILVFHIILFWTNVGKNYFPLYFAVQVFLFISGYLYAKKDIKDIKKFYYNNIIKLVLPIIIFIFLTGLIYGFSVTYFGVTTCEFDIGNLWFLYAILPCYLILPFLNSVKNKIQNKKFDKAFKFLIFLIVMLIILDLFLMSITQSLLISFITGYFYSFFKMDIKKENESSKIFNFKNIFLPVLFIILFALLYYVFYNYVDLSKYILNLIKEICVLGIGLSFTIFSINILKPLNKYNLGKFLKFSDKNSYYFYIVQQLFLCGSFSVQFLTNSPFLNIILAALFILIYSCVVQLISENLIKLIKIKPKTIKNNK